MSKRSIYNARKNLKKWNLLQFCSRIGLTVLLYKIINFFYRCSEKRIFFGGSFGKNLTSDNILWWVGSITAIRMAQSVVHYIGHKFFGAGDEASPKRWPHRRPEPQYLKGDPMEILHFYRQTIMGTWLSRQKTKNWSCTYYRLQLRATIQNTFS